MIRLPSFRDKASCHTIPLKNLAAFLFWRYGAADLLDCPLLGEIRGWRLDSACFLELNEIFSVLLDMTNDPVNLHFTHFGEKKIFLGQFTYPCLIVLLLKPL